MQQNNNQSLPGASKTHQATNAEIINMQLSNSINSAIRDDMTQRLVIKTKSGTLLNDLLIGRTQSTKNMIMVPKASLERKVQFGPFIPTLMWFKLAESRLTRFLKAKIVYVDKHRSLPLKGGTVIDASVESSHRELEDYPILFVDLNAEPTGKDPDPEEVKAYELCKSYLLGGLTWKCKGNVISTEYCQSSASELRTLVGLFVRKDLKFTEEYLAGFKAKNDSAEAKAELEAFLYVLRNLCGAEVIYTAMSYGAYLTQYKGVNGAISKFMARMGMSQTSTKSLGNDFTVKHIGDIKISYTDEIKEAHRQKFTKLLDKNGLRIHSDRQIEAILSKIEALWKAEKLDGQNVIRASAVIRGLGRLAIKLKESEVIGKLIQFRWAGVKGTALVVPDAWLDAAVLPNGSFPYRGYDIIVENASWKYTPWLEWWNGAMAPELELVAVSKSKSTSNMNFQHMIALDGNEETVPTFEGIVTRQANLLKDSMSIPEVGKAYNGIKASSCDSLADDISIDEYEKSMTTIAGKALEACDDIITDFSYRIKHINRTTRMKDKMGYGKIPIEGKNRFVVSDPTPFFRTDLAVPMLGKDGKVKVDHEGNDMFDIVITKISQLAIQSVDAVYWNDYEKPAVLFRSPCVHPGEPQKVRIVGINSIPKTINTGYGVLNIGLLFESCKDLVIINALSYILDALGGGDTDGDTILIVTEPGIVELKSDKRLPMLISIDNGTHNVTITPSSVKQFMVECLKDAGIGLITNYATTWRDIELMTVNLPNPIDGKYKLPEIVVEALEKMAENAIKYLKVNSAMMSDLDIKAAKATAAMCHINNDKHYNHNKTTGVAGWPILVINACEANLELTRYLQETAINTAKSGVFVNFNCYPWIKIGVRASWHRPRHARVYKSWSPMGQLHEFVQKTWVELREWAQLTSKPLPISNDVDWSIYRETYKTIRELKASFGTEVYEINKRFFEMEESQDFSSDNLNTARMNANKDLAAFYNAALRGIAIEVGSMDDVSKMVYHTNIDRDKDNEEGLAFIWNCWGEEFVHTLRHINSGKASKKLVIIRMDKKYQDMTLSNGEYLVEDNKVRLLINPEETVAHCKVPDGLYEVMVYNEKAYLLLDIVRKDINSMTAGLKGVKVKLVGMSYNSFEGKTMTRDLAMELLKRAGYVMTITGGIVMRMGKDKVQHEYPISSLVYVNIDGMSVCIGNFPQKGATKDETGYFSRALYEKVARVLIPKNANSLDLSKEGKFVSLSVEVIEILEDLITKK